MAILSHKWLMLWRKKHIFINISWHGDYGPLLSLFEDLEVAFIPIAWGVFWPIIQFRGRFFCSIWRPVILAVFYPQNHPFLDLPGPRMAPGWGVKVSNTCIPITWGVFWCIFMFPGGLLS